MFLRMVFVLNAICPKIGDQVGIYATISPYHLQKMQTKKLLKVSESSSI